MVDAVVVAGAIVVVGAIAVAGAVVLAGAMVVVDAVVVAGAIVVVDAMNRVPTRVAGENQSALRFSLRWSIIAYRFRGRNGDCVRFFMYIASFIMGDTGVGETTSS